MLEIDAVSSGYTHTSIIKDVSITVDNSEIVTLIGPNGAGKSTLLKAVCGLLPIYQGTVTFKNRDLDEVPAHQRVQQGIGYVPQERGCFTRLTVDENLSLAAHAGATDGRDTIYDLFPILGERRSSPVHRLSGGERRMVALARVLMTNPDIILFDEPSAGLMPKLRSELYDRIQRVNREQDTAFLIVEQNVSLALTHAEHAYILRGGKIVHSGSTAALDGADAAALFF